MSGNEITAFSEGNAELTAFLQSISNKHKNVSNIKTPSGYVHNLKEERKRPDRLLYIDAKYMRNKANELYPGWSWEVVNSYPLGDSYFIVHGRLTWYESDSTGKAMKRTGDMVDAHRIQKKRDSDEYVDVGNDVKSANTDCLKKAINIYLNIGDDIYGWEDLTISDEDEKQLLVLAEKANKINEVKEAIKEGRVSRENIDNYVKRLNELIDKESSNV